MTHAAATDPDPVASDLPPIAAHADDLEAIKRSLEDAAGEDDKNKLISLARELAARGAPN